MIKVTDLHKSFGELAVLKGIDFQADTGEVVFDGEMLYSKKKQRIRAAFSLE